MGFGKSLEGALDTIGAIVPKAGKVFMLLMIFPIILGATYKTAVTQNLLSNFTKLINGTLSAISTAWTNITGGVNTATGIIGLVVILALFGFLLYDKKKKSKGGSGDSGNNMFGA